MGSGVAVIKFAAAKTANSEAESYWTQYSGVPICARLNVWGFAIGTPEVTRA